MSLANITVSPKTDLSAPLYRPFAVFLTSCLFHLFSAKTFLSEIPSFRSLLSLSLANITVSPKTDLSALLYRAFAVFLTFRLLRSLFVKAILSEIPSPRSLLSLLHACIIRRP